ncbi:MAG TPA: LrgB family protein [Candidatus Competibacteraceae bacterium]|nr:MAG: LrgB family protein [Candidatus Competibacteraceae bacterium]HOB61412.1 LrgB family protein [Candidatus Competibacteraceae bacterium]HQA27466.1 LrgB family protein [Candidatus Competibacteraceae bacterium]HQD57031.1 LrgB family protein [Candidatus Competibacteraceae bacterium]
MDKIFNDVWVYLAASPLLWLTVTLAVYLAGQWLFQRSGGRALFNPVALAITLLVALLLLTGTPYSTYFQGAQFIHFLLGPATVALAVPLYLHWERVRQLFLPIVVGLLVGSATAIFSAIGVAWLLGGTPRTLLSLAPKSVTTPVAMGIAEKIGGLPSLTAVLVILTGVIGAVAAPALLNGLRIRDDAIKGIAIGVAAHGIGTARAFQISAMAGAFSGLAIGLNALLTALLVPLIVKLLHLTP